MTDYIRKSIGYKQTIDLLNKGNIIIDYTFLDNGTYSIIVGDYLYSVRSDSMEKLLRDKVIKSGHNLAFYTGNKADRFLWTYVLNKNIGD